MHKVLSKFALFILVLSMVFFSCSKPKPQLPSNKVSQTDSLSTALVEINTSLTEKEDSILTAFTAKHYPEFKKTELGFWILTNCKTEDKQYKMHDECSFEVKIFNLNRELLMAEKKTIVIGRKETIAGIEETLKLISKGCGAKMILPWYLAYGTKGNGAEIPPYTSVYVELLTSQN